MPPTKSAGNVIRKGTTVKVSVRLPPNFDSDKAKGIIESKLLSDPPYNSYITLSHFHTGNGFCAKPLPAWLKTSLDLASEAFWGEGHPCKSYGIGFSIPFLSALG